MRAGSHQAADREDGAGEEGLSKAVKSTIEGWGEALEAKDPGTWSHCKRVAAFETVLSRALNLVDAEVRVIACGRCSMKSEAGDPGGDPAKARSSDCGRKVHHARAAEIVRSHRQRFDGSVGEGVLVLLGARANRHDPWTLA